MLLDGLHRRHRVEPLHEDDGAADLERDAEHHVEPEDVEHRQDAECDVGGGLHVARRREHLSDVGVEVGVAEHCRTRRAGSAGGEDQDRRVRRLAVDGRGRLGGDEVVEVQPAVRLEPGADDELERRERLPSLVVLLKLS